MSEDCSGNYVLQSRDVIDSFFIQSGEALRHCQLLFPSTHHCQDVTLFGIRASHCYESAIIGTDAMRSHFCVSVWDGTSDMLYCQYCVSCQECFGCSCLHRKQYCILNTQYTKEEYESIVPRIIESMRRNGSWGEFFPIHLSSVPYNRSLAQLYFPLTKEEAIARGYPWYDEPERAATEDAVQHEDRAQGTASRTRWADSSCASGPAEKQTGQSSRPL